MVTFCSPLSELLIILIFYVCLWCIRGGSRKKDRGAEQSNKNSLCLSYVTVHLEVHGITATSRGDWLHKFTNLRDMHLSKNAMRACVGCRSGRHATRHSTLAGCATVHRLSHGVAVSLSTARWRSPARCFPSQLDAGQTSPVAAQIDCRIGKFQTLGNSVNE